MFITTRDGADYYGMGGRELQSRFLLSSAFFYSMRRYQLRKLKLRSIHRASLRSTFPPNRWPLCSMFIFGQAPRRFFATQVFFETSLTEGRQSTAAEGLFTLAQRCNPCFQG